MGLVETEGVVLKSFNLAEADRIIVIFTRKLGLVRGVAHGARRLKSKFGGALEPFTSISVSFNEKEGRELITIRNTDIKQSLFALAHETNFLASIGYMANMLLQFAPPNEPNEKLYRMLIATIDALHKGDSDLEGITRYFELWLLRLSGFLPDLRRCTMCGRSFVAADGVFQDADLRFQCVGCSGGRGLRITTRAYELVCDALRRSPTEFAASFKNIDRPGRDEFENITKRFIQRVLETDNDIARVRSKQA